MQSLEIGGTDFKILTLIRICDGAIRKENILKKSINDYLKY